MKLYLALVPAFALAGCATGPKPMYEWGSYQPSLLSYTKSADAVEFEKELRETIDKGERKGSVPPGVYAELGYLLMQSKRPSEAVTYFEKEKVTFPESRILMDKMIAGATSASAKGDDNAS